MALYEIVFILRQDIAAQDVSRISGQFEDVLLEGGAKIIKKESWGLRPLAYVVKKNKKGHYLMLGVEAEHTVINEMVRKLKISEDAINYLVKAVDVIDENPSPMLQAPTEIKYENHFSSDAA